jgi:SAM-dependent methyltransferase
VIELLHRFTNGVRKIAHGLRPFSESVWPGVRSDLFVAHESIYAYAARYVRGLRVLDAGCGTGYGSHLLARHGARSVIGIDLDARNVAFARKRYTLPNLAFEVQDLERLAFDDASFGFVIASNALEHLHDPDAFLEPLGRLLAPDGQALIAVPPIYGDADARVHAGIHYHRSNLRVGEWLSLLERAGFEVTGVLHETSAHPNFQSHRPSRLTTDDFTFTEVGAAELARRPSITAMFLLRRTTPGSSPPAAGGS